MTVGVLSKPKQNALRVRVRALRLDYSKIFKCAHTHTRMRMLTHALGAHTHVDIFYGDRRRRVGPESTHSTSSHSGAEHSIRVGMLRFFFLSLTVRSVNAMPWSAAPAVSPSSGVSIHSKIIASVMCVRACVSGYLFG